MRPATKRERDRTDYVLRFCGGDRRAGYAGLVVTEWEEIRTLKLGRAALLMEEPKVLVDGRNVLDPGEVEAAGIRYRGFGRGCGLGHGRSQAADSSGR